MEYKAIRKKRNRFLSCFILLALIVFVLAGIGLYLTDWYNNAIYQPNSPSTEAVAFTVAPGDSLVNIADSLEEKGLIKSKDALRIYLRLNNLSPNIKAGEYSIQKNLNVPQLIEIFEDGVFKPAIWITIKEGLRNEDIGSLINSKLSESGVQKNFDYNEFLSIVNTPSNYNFSDEANEFLKLTKPLDKPLTGFLFPDTYRIDTDSDAMEVIETMILNLKKRMEDNLIDVTNVTTSQNQLQNFYEALTLASIIEKESGQNDDATIISGIFHNRLEANYMLESDATVNFATGKNVPGASFEDLQIDSPYNTYKYTGLTPTPINNPGIRAIKASLNPANTDYFYFRHDSNGNIHYSVTFQQHQQSIFTNP